MYPSSAVQTGVKSLRMREQHAPRVSEPLVEADATVRRLRLEIGRCFADLESHVLLPYAAALVVSRPSAVIGSTGITNRSRGSLYPRRQGAHPSDVVVENRYAEARANAAAIIAACWSGGAM
jgi:hypothetical protein